PILGQGIESGALNAKIDLKSTKRKIKGVANLELNQLNLFAVAGDATAKALQKGAGKKEVGGTALPLDASLGMLRDDHNNIKLKLPISGDLDAPDININDAINTAVTKAAREAAFYYLANTLQPFGAIMLVAKAADAINSHVRLEPIHYPPGVVVLSESGRDYLGKLSKLLKERKEIKIKVCGVAWEADRQQLLLQKQNAAPTAQAQPEVKAADNKSEKKGNEPPPAVVTDEELLALAQQRAEGVRKEVASIDKGYATRLISCRPTLGEKGGTSGSVVEVAGVDLQI
ncbi:MAG: hypothetical protein HQL48_11395, partial [Gammaproteobacteria bacterium]|nr:hypothetical protein [Gammaproteobacteria bacterium]